MVSARTRTSELIGPLQPGRRGKTVLRVPGDSFDADHHHLQLLSFRDEELRGPAASDVVEVPWRWTPPSRRYGPDAVAASMSLGAPATPIAFEQRLSHAQFLDALARHRVEGAAGGEEDPADGRAARARDRRPVEGRRAPAAAGGGAAGGGGGTTTAPAKPDLGHAARPAAAADHPGDRCQPAGGDASAARSGSEAAVAVVRPVGAAPLLLRIVGAAARRPARPLRRVGEGADARDDAGPHRRRRPEQADEDGVRRARLGREDRPGGHRQAARAPAGAQPGARRRRAHPAAGLDVDVPNRRAPQALAPGEPRHRRSRPGRPRRLPAGGVPPRRRDQPARHRRHRPPDPPAHAASPAQGRRHARHSWRRGSGGSTVSRPVGSRSRPCCRPR